MHNMRLRFQKGDTIAIAAVFLLAVLVFMLFLPERSASAGYAEIYLYGELVRTVSLQEEQEFTLTADYSNTITVAGGKIAVTDANCPGKDCVRYGWTESGGKSIVCLPNGLEIRILAGNDDVDFVVG